MNPPPLKFNNFSDPTPLNDTDFILLMSSLKLNPTMLNKFELSVRDREILV